MFAKGFDFLAWKPGQEIKLQGEKWEHFPVTWQLLFVEVVFVVEFQS